MNGVYRTHSCVTSCMFTWYNKTVAYNGPSCNVLLRITTHLQVTELNIFGQKSVDSYRGFAQFNTHPCGGPPSASRSCDGGQEGAPAAPVLLCELLVQLPKVSVRAHIT